MLVQKRGIIQEIRGVQFVMHNKKLEVLKETLKYILILALKQANR